MLEVSEGAPSLCKARVLLADDHDAVLSSLGRLLDTEFDVVGTVTDGTALLEAAERLSPDLIVLDIAMPKMDGIEAARRLRAGRCPSKLVFHTVHAESALVEAALAAGATGYVLKSRSGTDLVTAIRTVAGGGTFLSPPLGPDPGESPA